MVKIIRFNENNFKIFQISKFFTTFFFYMFDLQLDQLPPLSSTHPFKESLLVFIKYMNGISENDETL